MILPTGDLRLQEANEFRVPVALHAAAKDRASSASRAVDRVVAACRSQLRVIPDAFSGRRG